MEGRFSTREADPINPVPKRKEVSQNVIEWNGRISLRLKNKRVVMAVRTTEIAVGEEEDRADFPWPIHKGGFQKSLDLSHRLNPSADRDMDSTGEIIRFRKYL
jgi:hypothetical protein